MDFENERRIDPPSSRRIKYVQIFMGVISNLASIGPGMSLGFSAIALPQLTSSTNSFQLTPDQESWFAGLAAITMPIGCLLSGPILDRFGRKTALLLVNVPCIIGWLLIATVGDTDSGYIEQLYIGRLFTGLATGMTSVPATIYLAEVSSSNSLRSMLVTWTSISIAAGVLLVYILGAIFQESWRVIAFICAVFPLVAFILIAIILPESPVWLMGKGRSELALKSLKLLRGQKSDHEPSNFVQEEFDKISLNHTNSLKSQENQTFKNNLKIFLRPEGYKPFIIMNAFFFFQQTSGVFVVIFYAVDVANEAGVTIDKYLATVLIGVVRFGATIIVSLISKKVGRRPPSILSGVGMTFCMIILALYLLLISNGTINEELSISLGWLPVVLLLLYIGSSTIGFLTIPWAMLGEVYPTQIRGVASGTSTCFAYTVSFFVVKGYPMMLSNMGKSGVFLFYGIMALIGTIFIIVFLPETLGRSLQEIEDYFTRKSKLSETDAPENGLPLLGQGISTNTAIICPVKSNLDHSA